MSRLAIRRGSLLTLLAIGLPAIASLLAPLASQDIAYQVRAGQLMLDAGRVLEVDPFTFTVAGAPWLNQAWGAGIVLGAGFETVGWSGLLLLRALLIGATFGLVFAACRGVGANQLVAAVVTLASFVVAMSNLALRSQTFGILCFAAVVAVLVYRRRYPWLLVAIPFVFLAWANTHGSFFIGWAALAVAAVEDLRDRRGIALATVGIALLAIVATLLNPYGVRMWTYVVELSTDPLIPQLVSEWQPSTLRAATGAFFFISAAAMVVLLLVRGRVISWLQLAWLAGLIVLGLSAVRGVAWWAVGAAPIAATLLAGVRLRGRRLGDPTLDAPRGLGYGIVASLLLLLLVAALPHWRAGDPLYGPDSIIRDAPRAVTATLRAEATEDDRLLAEQTWGSWLAFAAPDVPLMVDSRIELFDEAVWADYLHAVDGRADWPQILDRWGVTLVALRPTTPLADFVDASPDWTRLGGDDEGEVYRRR